MAPINMVDREQREVTIEVSQALYERAQARQEEFGSGSLRDHLLDLTDPQIEFVVSED